MNKFDLTKLENLADGFSAQSVTISPESAFLILMALDDRACYRGAWVDDNGDISDARWDAALAIVENAKREVMIALD